MKRLSFLVIVCVLVCLTSTVAAQTGTRVESSQLLATSRTGSSRSTIPSSETHADIRTDNLQMDGTDPLHSCYGNDVSGSTADNAGTYSMFTRIVHPGGELFVNTTGSNYDTVVSVFTYADAGVALGAALACNDDQTPGSNTTSFIDINLPAGQYLVMISRYSLTSSGTALSLKLDIAYLPQGVPPSNDNPATPIALTAHKVNSQSGVHFATDSTLEQDLNATCAIYNSVWYSYTAPAYGEYQFTSHGSVFQVQPNLSYGYASTIGVYSSNFDPDTSTTSYLLEGCYTSVNYNAVTDPIYMSPGLNLLLRVGTAYNINLLPNSTYKIKPVVTHVALSTNDGFEEGLMGWKTAKFDAGDGLVGDVVTINAGMVKKTLSQTKTTFPAYVKWAKGGILQFAAGYTYTGIPSGKFTVTIVYSDGKPNTVVNIPFSTSTGGYTFVPIALASTKVQSVKIAASVNPGSGASVSIDFMVLDYDRDPSAARDSGAVLPFPTRK